MVAAVRFQNISKQFITIYFLKEKGEITDVPPQKKKLNPDTELFVFRWEDNENGWKDFYLAIDDDIKKGLLSEKDRLEILENFLDKMPDNDSKVNFCRYMVTLLDEIVSDLTSPDSKTSIKNRDEVASHTVVQTFLMKKALGISINE